MALKTTTKETKLFTVDGGGAVAFGSTLKLKLENTDRRLEKIRFYLPITLSGSFGTTAARNLLEGIFDQVQFKMSDQSNTARLAVDTNSASLYALERLLVGKTNRYTRQAAKVAANGTYYAAFTLNFVPPQLSEFIAYRYAVPLDTSVQKSEPELSLRLAANAAAVGMTGTVAFGTPRAQLNYVEIGKADNWAYVPATLSTRAYQWPNTTADELAFDRDGLLPYFLHETFTSATARGDILASGSEWGFKLGRVYPWNANQILADMEDDEFVETAAQIASPAAGVTANLVAANLWNFLHPSAMREALSGDSVPSLYTPEGGDAAKLIHRGLASVGTGIESYVTSYRLLTPDRNVLKGA